MEINEKEQKTEFKLTNENYHSPEARKRYLGNSSFKEFLKCEVMGLARANGEIEEKKSDALLFGAYVDAYFSGELNEFIAQNPDMFTKQGTLKSQFKAADDVIKTIEEDPVLMKYLDGQKQVIMTGEIAGVPFKIKMDAYHPGKVIVDQKIMKDMEPMWIEKDGKNVLTDFVSGYGYDIQGAIYQTIEAQNSADHKKLPFVLAVTTKEDVPDKELIEIDQYYLESALDLVKAKAPRFWDIIQGKIEPVGCGHCPACRARKKLTGVKSYERLFKEKEEQ